jgi:hypothetical protein
VKPDQAKRICQIEEDRKWSRETVGDEVKKSEEDHDRFNV